MLSLLLASTAAAVASAQVVTTSPAPAPGAQPNVVPQPGDKVLITTDAGSFEGVLVDRAPDGYLINTAAGTTLYAYTAVRSITKVFAPGVTPTPPPAGSFAAAIAYGNAHPLGLRDDQPLIAQTRTPVIAPLFNIGFEHGLSTWTRKTVVGKLVMTDTYGQEMQWIGIPASRFVNLRADSLVVLTSAKPPTPTGTPSVDSGLHGEVVMGSFWAEPYLRYGRISPFVGVGLAGAYTHMHIGGTDYEGLGFGPVFGGGFDLMITEPNLTGFQGGAWRLRVELDDGTITTDEHSAGRKIKIANSGPALAPMRATANIAFSFDVRRLSGGPKVRK